MADDETPITEPAETPAFMRFPTDMKVAQVDKSWAVNSSKQAAWLWVRFPNHVIALDFDADQAEKLGLALIEQARVIREAAKIVRPELRLLGPEGSPVHDH